MEEHEHLFAFDRKLSTIAPAWLLKIVTEQAIMFPADLWMLWVLSQVHPAKNIIEIGSYRGASMLWLAWANQAEHIVCIDPWVSSPITEGAPELIDDIFAAYELNVRLALDRFRTRTTTVRDRSENVSTAILDGWADMVFIDGDHTKEAVRHDLHLYWPKVRAGGIMTGHDYSDLTVHPDHRGIVEAVNEWDEEYKTALLAPARIFMAVKD